MNVTKQTLAAPCPDCEEMIELGPNPHQGQKFTCPNCWAYLEIINLAPLELDWNKVEFEDEEEEEEDDDDWE
jgi:hypothetical protein